MDLSTLKPSNRTIQIVHPATGEPIGLSVTLVALSDERLKKVKRRIQDDRLRLDARGKHFKSDDVEENTYELLYNAMTGWEWHNDCNFKNEQPVFNKVNVEAVLKELPWVRDQIDEALGDEKAFFQTSART